MTVKQLVEVLKGWDPTIKVVDKEGKAVRGARIVVEKGEAKVKLG